jgi:ligand-binding SRPBCC domain-containing protein
MPTLTFVTEVRAPIDRVFDLARSIDLHCRSTAITGETAIAGTTTGLIGLGEEVTWRARHFGVWQTLTSRITAFSRPDHFRDSLVRGAFRRFDHDHFFAPQGNATIMRDVFDFTSPHGVLGRVADELFLKSYMRRLLEERNRVIKEVAEGEEWKQFLKDDGG